MTATTFKLVRTPAEVRERFEALAADWRATAQYLSNTRQMSALRPYQQIIALGPPAVPLMLEQLARGPEFWFHALELITGVNPVPAGVAGNVQAITDAWVGWGQQNGLLPPK